MPPVGPKLQSEEDVEAILHLALKRKGSTERDLRERLLQSADELGLTPEEIDEAERLYHRDRLAKSTHQFVKQTSLELYKQEVKAKAIGGVIGFVSFVLLSIMGAICNAGQYGGERMVIPFWFSILFAGYVGWLGYRAHRPRQ